VKKSGGSDSASPIKVAEQDTETSPSQHSVSTIDSLDDLCDAGPSPSTALTFRTGSRRSSPSSAGGEEHFFDPDYDVRLFDQQMVIDSLEPPVSLAAPYFSPTLAQPLIPGLSPSSYSRQLQKSPSMSLSPSIMFNIPRPLSSQSSRARMGRSEFFMKYHKEKIREAHYFRWHDYPKLHTVELFILADQNDVLRHAMVAFSALIYSINRPAAREMAFVYYALALKELRALLNASMDFAQCLTAVATALELSAFDVCPHGSLS
jgi:hypothetical protein